jgi:subtilisin
MPAAMPALDPLPRSLVLLRDWERGYADLVDLVGEYRLRAAGEGFPWLGALLIHLDHEEQEKLVARGGFDGVCEMLPRRAPEIVPSPPERFPPQVQGLTRPDDTGASIVKAHEMKRLAHLRPSTTWCLDRIGVGLDTACGSAVRMAVIDTGIEYHHPDFEGRVTAMRGLAGGDDCSDSHGHGTHCAGIAAGPASPEGRLRYGVAARVSLLVAKVFDDFGHGSDEEVLTAIHWAVQNGARVINLSLGSPRVAQEAPSQVYERVASRLLERNVLLVAAAGNASDRPALVAPVANPAACPSVVSTAATDEKDRVARFSCGDVDGRGRVDLSAPGVDVWSAFKGQAYSCLSGTSMAAPHVAGMAALLLSRYPDATAAEIRDRLLASARVLGESRDFGAGLVQYR